MKLRNNCYLNKSLILAKNIGDSKYAARNGADKFFVVGL
ncbi:hypothetical protein T10_1566 [Trichinella papuae]|uniref:Uncharacterized protein n=1 Tax=Trichinella papuae TaxID=268474 RepID=A0A0V1LZC9_9BILA|nr:hypothetical protein T10_1566 [Trichinella papuae]